MAVVVLATSVGCSGGLRPDLDTGAQATGTTSGGDDTVAHSNDDEEGSSSGGAALDVGTAEQQCDSLGLSPSSIGCSFVAGMGRQGGVALVNVSSEPANVTIEGTTIDEVTVPPGETVFALWDGDETPFPGIRDDLVRFIDSDRPIQAWQFFPPVSSDNADAALLLPQHALGTRHRLVSYVGGTLWGIWEGDPEPPPPLTPYAQQYLIVHALKDGTEVTVQLHSPHARANVAEPAVNPSLPGIDVAGGVDSMTVVIDRGQTLVLADYEEGRVGVEPPEADWSGGVVTASAPVAVFMASATALPWDAWSDPVSTQQFGICCMDTIAAAIPPTQVLGTEYVAAKTKPLADETDVFRVVADQADTRITIVGDVQQELTLGAGEFADVETDGAIALKGNHPFSLAQFLVSQTVGEERNAPVQTHDCGERMQLGDPALDILFPVENWLDRYRFPAGAAGISGGGWCNNHATVVARLSDWADITLDGDVLPAASEIGSSGFGFARVPLQAGDVYELRSANGSGVQLDVYGFAEYGSYFYPGGTRLEAVNPEG